MSKKKITAVLAANGGLHNARALKKAENILLYHTFREPYLYHAVLTGSQSISDYQAAIKAVVRKLRTHGCAVEYFGAYEMDDEKGLHAHVFLLIEADEKRPLGILDVRNEDTWVNKMMRKHGLNSIHIAKPQNNVHRTRSGKRPMYARPTLRGGRLADCLEWCSYLFKHRSKTGVPSREVYFTSEFKSNQLKRELDKPSLLHQRTERNVESFSDLDQGDDGDVGLPPFNVAHVGTIQPSTSS